MKLGELEINKVYNMDCIEGMKMLPDKCIDLVFADPDYNAKNIGPNSRTYENGMPALSEERYGEFCRLWFAHATRIAFRIILTSGIANIWNYPKADWIINWRKPSTVSYNRFGGFNVWEPILIYGKMPKGKRLPRDEYLYDSLNFNKGPEKEHPCPKNIRLIKRIIHDFSIAGDLILDPFLGSGTTAVACIIENRNFIGFEIESKYCEIANKRINAERNQLKMFV